MPDSRSQSDLNPTVAPLLDEALELHEQGAFEEAEKLYKNVLLLDPKNFTSIHCLGVIESQRGHFQAALTLISQALALNPRSAMAHLNKGIALGRLNRYPEALLHYQLSLALNKNNPDALVNRGIALHCLNRHQEALASYDQCLALKPDFSLAHSNKIFTMDYLPDFGFEAQQRERRAFFNQLRPDPPAPFRNLRDPERRLVVGYVSADFFRHSAASCFGPVLLRHDRKAFKIIGYSGGAVVDDWTRRFQDHADLWRETGKLGDAELAAQIREDEVDILVDLSGHTSGNRLPVFARKPAPIQVTAWGHGGGTGLPMMDYQFTDPVLIPPEVRHLFAETAYDLPCAITFAKPEAPPVAPLPALTKGYVTFGNFNRFMKVTPDLQALWARILLAVPGSRLLLKDARFEDPGHRDSLRQAFATLGVQPERIELLGFTSHQEHLAAYAAVDCVLDTFPQNGGITTWEALWMGAPVLTVLGNACGSRISGAILHALELDDWIAGDEADYLRLAVARASNLAALADFRATLRTRIETSAAGNPDRYTEAVEAGYRAMWKQWLDLHP